ncbi:MAG TPA: hypothetical protein DD640_02225 [Clostridiales bacterium]|nr:hypothetical protein [Clostridiales bacterium]
MIIDSHVHLGYTHEFWFYDTSVRRLTAEMDRLQIDYVINAHSEALMQENFTQAYTECLQAYAQSGGRILSYHVYNPNRGRVCLDLMEKYDDPVIFKGIKIHPSQHGVYADSPAYNAVWQYANDRGLPILSHTWALSAYNPVQRFSVPERFVPYIEQYPAVPFICGHAGGRYESIITAADMAAKYPNVYLDIAGDVYACNLIPYLAGRCQADKILFASDLFWCNPAAPMGMILTSGLDESQTSLILGGNAARIFRINSGNGGQA